MNARMKLVPRDRAGLFLVSVNVAGADGRLQAGKWARLKNGLRRMTLLWRSPISSFCWAQRKRKAVAKKKRIGVPAWQRRRNNTFAEYEREGIVMGF
jgi:hypothetical protein